MVFHSEQSVCRRLNFDEVTPEAEAVSRRAGNGGERNSTLPRVSGTGTSDDPIIIEDEATESSPGGATRIETGGYRLLYEGSASRTHRFTCPPRGMAVIVTRRRNGMLYISSVPNRAIFIDDDGTESDTSGEAEEDEGNDRLW